MVSDVKRVAVIGAGVSGLTAARHLRSFGLEVVVYERSSTAGGVWSYDERQPPEPTYPSIRPSVADFVADSKSIENEKYNEIEGQEDLQEKLLQFAPPGPAYAGLTTNISTVLQELKNHPWKEGTEDFVNVQYVGDYLKGFSRAFEIQPLIRFNTRVERLEKREGKWNLTSSILIIEGPSIGDKDRSVEEFDAVVIASGHYHSPRIPDILGLKEWKSIYPSRIQHSKSYRHPQEFAGQSVLLIGAGVSSTDIAREISPLATKIYQSSRSSPWDLPASFLPANTTRIAEIASFSPPSLTSHPTITLKDGTVLEGIDRVVICTGYHISYPFLKDFHADEVAPESANENVLVTDGTMVHNLHKDIFYIPDPTLAFVGTSYYVATFTLFEFQSIAVAAVFSGRSELPTREEMKQEYETKIERKGLGRGFHSLKDQEKEYVEAIVDWVNEGNEEKVEGHSARWLEEEKVRLVKIRKMFEIKEALLDLEILKKSEEPWKNIEQTGERLVEA